MGAKNQPQTCSNHIPPGLQSPILTTKIFRLCDCITYNRFYFSSKLYFGLRLRDASIVGGGGGGGGGDIRD